MDNLAEEVECVNNGKENLIGDSLINSEELKKDSPCDGNLENAEISAIKPKTASINKDDDEHILNGSAISPVDTDPNQNVPADDNDLLVLNYELEVLKVKKRKKILDALISHDVNLLNQYAIEEHGLISDDLRCKIWPKLVGVDIYATSPKPSAEEMENHPYYQQVILDVNRSLKRFPPSIKEKQRLAMQDQLVLLIMRILVKNPSLHYYQGYHDICVTFLLVLGEEMAFHVVNKLSISHLEVFMRKNMEPTTNMLHYIYPIVEKENSNLYEFLEKADVGIIFSLSWLITWFGHVLNNYSDVVRLFDIFIASSFWLPVYLSAAIVLHRGKEIQQQECDMPTVHSFLCMLPDNLPFEDLIVDARHLFDIYPPKSLDKVVAERIERKRRVLKVHRRNRRALLSTVVRFAYTFIPTSKLTVSVVIAAAVVFSAVVYQSYQSKTLM